MNIPQLVQEIIDYYLYFVPWKARTEQLNEEYRKKLRSVPYNWRSQDEDDIYMNHELMIYNILTEQRINYGMTKIPPRYWYSNTKEQLKSLYF